MQQPLLPYYNPVTVHGATDYLTSGSSSNSLLKDNRRYARCLSLQQQMLTFRTVSISKLSSKEKERRGYSRFLNNDKINNSDLIDHVCTHSIYGHTSVTEKPLSGVKHMLVLGDNVNIDFSSASKRLAKNGGGLGVLNNNKTPGMLAHVSMAIDSENQHIKGLSDVILFNRSIRDSSQNSHLKGRGTGASRHLVTEQKESHTWRQGADNSRRLLKAAGSTQRTYIFDSDADSLENFNYLLNYKASNLSEQGQKDGFIIKAQYLDRPLETPKSPDFDYSSTSEIPLLKSNSKWKKNQKITLRSYLEKIPFAHKYEVSLVGYDFISKLKKRRQRKAREAILNVKYAPFSYCDNQGQYHTLYAVHVWEDPESLPDSEKKSAVNSTYITTLPVTNWEDARKIIFYYSQRWHIEQLFRTIKKQGLGIEKAQLGSLNALIRITTIAMEVGTQILRLVQARDSLEGAPIKEVFSEKQITLLHILCKKCEGNTDKQKNPYPENQLSYAAWVIARMGGWKVYNKKRPPGPIVMGRGLEKFYNIFDFYDDESRTDL